MEYNVDIWFGFLN